MPPKKRARRLTLRKSHKVRRKKPEKEADNFEKPSDEEWKGWEKYGACSMLRALDGRPIDIRVNDCVLLLPDGPTPTCDPEYWVARVREIRAPSAENVWMLVQWYYNPQEVANQVSSKSLVASSSSYELCFSDHRDLVPHTAIERVVEVLRYEENSLSPPDIPWNTFWTRYDYEPARGNLYPRPLSEKCLPQMCGAYHPDDEMRLCPRCMVWFHVRCIDATGVVPSEEQKAQMILSSRALFLRIMTTSTSLPNEESLAILTSVVRGDVSLPGISQSTIRMAYQPIARGDTFGITGNVKTVCNARKAVLEAFVEWKEEYSGGVPDTSSEDRLGKRKRCHGDSGDDDEDLSEDENHQDEVSYTCPSCQSPI